ncbi:gamma-glutamyltranspeptidase [Vibrio ishigakensis]|uniref:Gamma-glutamyltranspeptidase n=1 Tax=Vibrio ishigakensis TaxID=1481914 RepID=A0A0B8QM47_9VIBR|nr:gamma-glutamyltranspeptidase [Vibrio ishigakensis]
MSFQTAFTAPHHEAARVGQEILDAGGTASEAMVAAAAMIAVQYPHMNSIGGDGFWLICKPGETPIAIDACGRSALNLNVDEYRSAGEILSKGASHPLPWRVPSQVGRQHLRSMVVNTRSTGYFSQLSMRQVMVSR